MTATTTGFAAAAPVTERTRVGWGDLAWLTWRQHRWAITGLVVVVLGVAAFALGMAWHVDATGATHELFGRVRYVDAAQMLMLVPMTFGLAIAVFWAAPLLSREYEQRTHLVAWSQDITPTRWLAGKVVLLGVPAVALSVGLGLASIKLMNSLNAVMTEYRPFPAFNSPAFEVVPPVQAAYAAFGFALGLALSAVTRRTVLSMGLALTSFIVVRVVVTWFWRPYFQTPLRGIEKYDPYESQWDGPGAGAWTVDSGFADAAGNEMPFPEACSNLRSGDDYAKCMTDHQVNFFMDYHPVDRLLPFQLIESAIFAVLAAGLLAVAFAWVRRARRV
ncbi:hypothetical protein AB0425_07515 [Actinosynnema sp. NPDC051121]|nr:ABC transporter permease [Saccharothrix sp.]